MFPLGRVLSDKLNKEKALIFRITHVRNVDWILENGLPASSSTHKDPNFVSIGNAVSGRSIGTFCSAATSRTIPRTRERKNGIKPKLSSIGMSRSMP